MVRRAALALDLGRVAVSNAIWEKPGPFGLTDWERVQAAPILHRALVRPRARTCVDRRVAGAHHERLDGAGYHRKTGVEAERRASSPRPTPTRR